MAQREAIPKTDLAPMPAGAARTVPDPFSAHAAVPKAKAKGAKVAPEQRHSREVVAKVPPSEQEPLVKAAPLDPVPQLAPVAPPVRDFQRVPAEELMSDHDTFA